YVACLQIGMDNLFVQRGNEKRGKGINEAAPGSPAHPIIVSVEKPVELLTLSCQILHSNITGLGCGAPLEIVRPRCYEKAHILQDYVVLPRPVQPPPMGVYLTHIVSVALNRHFAILLDGSEAFTVRFLFHAPDSYPAPRGDKHRCRPECPGRLSRDPTLP